MMRRCIWLLLLPNLVIAQGGFSKFWQSGALETQVGAAEKGHLLVSSSPIHWNELSIWKTDSAGVLLDTSNVFLFPHTIGLRSKAFINFSNGRFISSHLSLVVQDSGFSRLVKFNSYLDTVKTAEIVVDSLGRFDIWAITQPSPSGGYIAATGTRLLKASNEYELFWLKIDTGLNVISHQIISKGLWGQHIQKCPNQEYLVSGPTSLEKPRSEGFVMRLDSIGNKLWERNFTGQYAVGAASPFENDTLGRWILMPQKVDATGSRSRLRLVELDANGNILKDTLLPYDFYHLRHTLNYIKKDGTLVGTGSTRRGGGFKHFIFNFTTGGDSLSLKFYNVGDDFDDSYTFSGYMDKDSNLVFGGLYDDFHNPPQGNRLHNWLLKTDKHGCVVSGCQNIGVEEFSEEAETSIALYPNPFRQAITLTWNPKEELLRKPTRAELRDATGRLVFSEKVENFQAGTHIFHLGKLPSGLYHFSLKQRGREIWVKKVIKN